MPLYDLFAQIDYPPLQAGLKGEQPGLSGRYMAALRYSLDRCLEKMRQAIASGQANGDPTTLAPLAQDRQVPQGFAESIDSWRIRLKRWLADRAWQGMPRGVMRQIVGYLSPYGPAIASVNNSGTWFSYATGADTSQPPTVTPTLPNDWNWDRPIGSLRWYRVWPIVDGSAWTGNGHTWGDGVKWGDLTWSWGFNLPSSVFNTMLSIFAVWKADHARYPAPIINLDPTNLFKVGAASGDPSLPDGTFGRNSKIVAGVRVPSRFANARYLGPVN